MSRNKKRAIIADFEDDGRTIAEMDIPGMPWHDAFGTPSGFGKRRGRRGSDSMAGQARELPPMSRRETWGIIANAVLAGLTIAGIFIAGMILFVLFCIFVWFR